MPIYIFFLSERFLPFYPHGIDDDELCYCSKMYTSVMTHNDHNAGIKHIASKLAFGLGSSSEPLNAAGVSYWSSHYHLGLAAGVWRRFAVSTPGG